MTNLDYVICNSNNAVIISRLELLINLMEKKENKNTKLINEFKDSIKRLEDNYLWFNQIKENTIITSKRNDTLEGLIISQKTQVIELLKYNKEMKEKFKLNEKIAIDNINLEQENIQLRETLSKFTNV